MAQIDALIEYEGKWLATLAADASMLTEEIERSRATLVALRLARKAQAYRDAVMVNQSGGKMYDAENSAYDALLSDDECPVAEKVNGDEGG